MTERRTLPKQPGQKNSPPLKWRLFVDAYLKNGGNATRAYMSAYPGAQYHSAGASAAALLKEGWIKDEIESRLHEIGTVEWIEREVEKDIIHGDKAQRTAALNLLAKIRGIVSERRINVEEQRKEFGEVSYSSYGEAPAMVGEGTAPIKGPNTA